MLTNQRRSHYKLFIALLITSHFVLTSAYEEEPIVATPPGFHVGDIQHEVATNQIVMQITLSASRDTIPVLYMSKEDWSSNNNLGDDVQTHPCESGDLANNNICCINAMIEQYQVSPSVLAMYDNSAICPYDTASSKWKKNFTEVSMNNPQLSEHLLKRSFSELDFLSVDTKSVAYNETVSVWENQQNIGTVYDHCNARCTGNNTGNNTGNSTDNETDECIATCIADCTVNGTGNGTGNSTVNCQIENITTNISTMETVMRYMDMLVYPAGVTYKILEVQDALFTVELRLNHEYLLPRTRITEVDSRDSGVSKYEFFVGVTFITLLPYTSSVSISTAQVSFEYFKSEFVFLSIATEQQATPVSQLDILIHQGKSSNSSSIRTYHGEPAGGPKSSRSPSLAFTRPRSRVT